MENRGMNEQGSLSLIDAIDNGRANNSWYLSCFVSAVRRIFLLLLASLTSCVTLIMFSGPIPEHTDAVLRQSVIRDWVIKINR